MKLFPWLKRVTAQKLINWCEISMVGTILSLVYKEIQLQAGISLMNKNKWVRICEILLATNSQINSGFHIPQSNNSDLLHKMPVNP